MDCSRDGLQPEMDDTPWTQSGDTLRQDSAIDRILIDDRRCISRYGSEEMNDWIQMTIGLFPI